MRERRAIQAHMMHRTHGAVTHVRLVRGLRPAPTKKAGEQEKKLASWATMTTLDCEPALLCGLGLLQPLTRCLHGTSAVSVAQAATDSRLSYNAQQHSATTCTRRHEVRHSLLVGAALLPAYGP